MHDSYYPDLKMTLYGNNYFPLDYLNFILTGFKTFTKIYVLLYKIIHELGFT